MSQFWTEDILAKLDLNQPQLLNDSKTPSGSVHMGSPISPAIHHAVYLRLQARGVTAEIQFGFDDFDVVDGLSEDLLATHSQYFGVPLFQVPPPPGSTASSFADHYIADYKQILNRLQIQPKFYRTSELYRQGKFDTHIRLALDKAADIRRIYKTVSGSDKGNDWLPFQTICQNCGKLGTTRVTSWDGEQVSYRCEPTMVTWAKGCGHEGTMSPFGGGGKMPWRVEWAAKWALFGVTFEAAGKDHASKGSSFDVCQQICREVFVQPAPLNIGHEFILFEGKKMSSSKGIGIKGLEFAQALPTTLLRYYYLRTRPNVAIDAQPLAQLTPRLFDDFDRLSQQVASGEDESQHLLWELSRMRPAKGVISRTVKFSTIVQWIQMPNVEVLQEAKEMLGSALSQGEQEIIESKMVWARYWLDRYASSDDKFEVQSVMPRVSLSAAQRTYVGLLAEKLMSMESAEEYQQTVYTVAKDMELSSRDAFTALYMLFLNRASGPKAGWLLHSLDKEFVLERLNKGGEAT